jgi:hypothetical protein
MGPGPLLRIHGVISDSSDVDVYCLNVLDPGGFSATVVGAAGFDTQLFLFSLGGGCPVPPCPPAGTGVVHDDDTPPGGIFQSTITAAFVPGVGPYALAISAYDRDPVDPGGQPIWNAAPVNAEHAPDGPGAAGLCAGWTDSGESSGEYWILLSGCAAWDPSPQPGAWYEAGDAPDSVPGQTTDGTGAITNVFGELSDGTDVDVYCISVTDPGAFSATTSGGVETDTELSLFSPAGAGIAFDDDDPTAATLFSRLTGGFVPGAGSYHLAVSRFERSAAGLGGGRMWERIPVNVERAADGPGPPPLTGWTGSGAAGGYYGVRLTGAEFCNGTTAVPEAPPVARARLDVRPNPVTASSQIRYWLPESGPVRVRIFDIGGRLVRTLVSERQPSGEHSVSWDGRDRDGLRVPAGIYTVRMDSAAHFPPQSLVHRKIVVMN